VFLKDQELKLKYGSLNLPLSHHHYDTFQMTYERYDFRELLTFYSDSNGDIDSITIRIEAALPPIRFTRQADEHLSDPSFLRKLVGKYDFFGRVIELTLREDNVLLFNMPGRNPEELVPVRGMRFRQKDSSSMTITFKSDENENIIGFVVSQMGAVIPGTRVTS
jgi:hypothetical protein